MKSLDHIINPRSYLQIPIYKAIGIFQYQINSHMYTVRFHGCRFVVGGIDDAIAQGVQ